MRFEELAVSAFGTAAQAGFWLGVEQAGPWGRDAATESHLPPDVGAALERACTERGGRLALLRRPGRHADTDHLAGRTAYLAFCGDRPWLLVAHDASLEDVLGVDLDALAAGDRAGVQASLPGARPAEPVLLVCTNGRRDVCCAVRGRPVALAAAEEWPGRVWESSHTGGHRFAPTGVLLPFGATLARLDAPLCAEVLELSGREHLPVRALGPAHDRGRSALAPPAQAAESHVRELAAETSLVGLDVRVVGEEAGDVRCEVVHVDGRAWSVVATRVDAGCRLAESCGKSPVPLVSWRVRVTGTAELPGPHSVR